jgi:uncharacterized linocin/CFP29 family protein
MFKKYLLSGTASIVAHAIGDDFGIDSAASSGASDLLNVLARRPFIDPNDGESKIVVNHGGGNYGTLVTNAPATLQYQEWLDIDRTVIEVGVRRLVGIADLQSRGLTHPLGSIGVTVSLWDRSSDMTGADVDMSGVTPGEEDTPAYLTASVPVPVIHKDFRINLRRLEASRRFGEAIDVTAANIASRVVAEASENMLFAGDPIVVEGATIYGYTNHPDRNQVDMAVSWASIAQADNDDIVADASAMLQAARNDRHYGPFIMYIPAAYEFKLDQDYRASDNRTLRQRLLSLGGLQDIKIADFMATDNVVLVELDRMTVDLATAQDITTVQWSHMGGMQERFKVMAIWVPRLKSDFDGRSGIVHLLPL